MYDPFEEVEPLPEIDQMKARTAEVSRSMMWDMIGPSNMQEHPELFGQHPASPDVLQAEEAEMWQRKNMLLPFGLDFQFLCYVAAEAYSFAVLNTSDSAKSMSEGDRMRFRLDNFKVGSLVAESVVSHLLQHGLITYGEKNE